MAQTVEDLGRALKAKHPGAYNDVSDADLGRALKAKHPGAYDDFSEIGQPQQPQAAAPSTFQSALEGAGNFAAGLIKGGASTMFHGGDLIRRGLGMNRVIDRPEVRDFITPMGGMQEAGFGAEKLGEFFIPSGFVGAGMKAVQGATAGMRGATLAQLAARSALEGTSAAGITGLQTGGDAEAMRQAGVMGAGTTAALGAGAAALPGIGRQLGRWAESQYGRVLHPTMKGTKHISRHETIPGLLERRVMGGTMQGLLDKTQAQADKWGKAVEDAWSRIPKNTPIEIGPMLQAIDDSVANASIGGVNFGPAADTIMNHAARMKADLTAISTINPQTGLLETTVGKLREAKQFSDMISAQAGAFAGKDLAETSLAAIYETMGNAARAQINPRFPTVAKAQEQFHFWKDANKVVDETIERKVGQQGGFIRNVGNVIGGGAGAAIGSMLGGTEGAAVGAVAGPVVSDILQRVMTSPAWRTASAVNKQRLADALSRGNTGEIEFYLAKILTGAREAGKRLKDEEKIQELLRSRGKKMLPYEYAPQPR